MAEDIVFSVSLDAKNVEKQIRKLEKDIEKSSNIKEKASNDKLPLEESLKNVSEQLDEAKNKLEELYNEQKRLQETADFDKSGKYVNPEEFLQAREQLDTINQSIADQETKTNGLQKEWDAVKEKVDKYNETISNADQAIAANEDAIRGLQTTYEELTADVPASLSDIKKGFEEAFRPVTRIIKRLFGLRMVLRLLRQVGAYFKEIASTNDAYMSALSGLRGALAAAFQPLYEIAMPALTFILKLLTAIVSLIGGFFSALTGKTGKQSAENAKGLNAEAKALKSVGGAAKDAQKQLAGFDEINKLQDDSGGGGGGGSVSPIDYDFTVTEDMRKLAEEVMLIAAGFALWKISEHLPGVLGQIASTVGLMLITIGGLALAWDGFSDALENGIDLKNLAKMIGGISLAAFGLYKMFGNVAAGIELVVGGVALLAVGFLDAEKNGVNFSNSLSMIAGIVATGLGFTLLSGSIIPAVIGAIAAFLASLAFATGHGEELIGGIRKVIDGFKDFFTGIFSGDMEKAMAGLNKLWEGMKEVVSAVWDGIKDASTAALDWLDEKTNGKVSEIIDWVKQFFTKDYWIDIFNALPEGMQDVLSSLWDSVVNTFNAISNKISGILSSIFGLKNAASGISVPSGGNTTRMVSPSDMGVSTYSIPALARGAVIPPNAPFLATLGDQRHGTNIEAPLDTIKQAVAEVMGDNTDAMMAGFEAVVRAIMEKDTVVQIGDDDIHSANKRYESKMAVVLGG